MGVKVDKCQTCGSPPKPESRYCQECWSEARRSYPCLRCGEPLGTIRREKVALCRRCKKTVPRPDLTSLREKANPLLREVINDIGATELAKRLGVERETVGEWYSNGCEVPEAHSRAFAQIADALRQEAARRAEEFDHLD